MLKTELYDSLQGLAKLYPCDNLEDRFYLYWDKFKNYDKEKFYNILSKLLDTYTFRSFPAISDIKKAEKELKNDGDTAFLANRDIKEANHRIKEEEKTEKEQISDFKFYNYEELLEEAQKVISEIEFTGKNNVDEIYRSVVFFRNYYKIVIPFKYNRKTKKIGFSKEVLVRIF